MVVAAAVALLLGVTGGRADAGAGGNLDSLSGRALVKRLEDPSARARAFHELWMRAEGRRTTSFDEFAKSHRDIELVVCPQSRARDPIYLLLYDFMPEFSFDRKHSYPIAVPDEIFPPETDAVPSPRLKPAIDAFTAAGQSIDPFAGNNVLDGTLADINSDGRVERVETICYGIDGIDTAEVLHVWAVEAKARPIFSVLINWGAKEWGYRLRDQDGDGFSEIEIGPSTDGKFSPNATFVWDAQARTYGGPIARDADHFRVIDPDSEKTEAVLETLRAAGLMFPAEPVSHSTQPERGKPGSPISENSSPYKIRALAGLPDEELLRLMGEGPNAYERERASVVKNQVPPHFWDTENTNPKAAALALADLNRTDAHRRRFRLALDDRDGAAPPASGTIAFTDASSRCYVASDSHYFLRFSPEESYLAFAASSSGGAVFYNVVSDRPAINLRLCPLPYENARHLAATLWWLDRVRSRDRTAPSSRFGGSFSSSTADGFGEIVFRNERGEPLLEKSDTLWAAQLSERWTEDYKPESFVNFAAWLISEAFVTQLGEAWTRHAPPAATISYLRGETGPLYSPEQLRHIATLADRFLALASQNPPRMSPGVTSVAVAAIGDLSLADARPALLRLLDTFPPDAAAPASEPMLTIDWPKVLREETAQALRKLDTARDPAALQAWAESRQPGGQWALRELAQLDPTRYARLLETWLSSPERPREGRQLFQELARVVPERAAELARALAPEKRRSLVPPALLLSAAPDETEGVKELVALLLDPASGWEQRSAAIEALVPAKDPMRHPQPEVDAALLRALDPDMADETVNFTCVAASRALARRGRIEHFDRIAKLFREGVDTYITDGLLAPLVAFAHTDPDRLNPRLAALLAPHLASTNHRMSEILWAIWAADLREFHTKLEQLATAGPEDYEDGRAVTSGGEVSPVTGRFHLARKIADIWHERDAFTRARLLAAFALCQPYEFSSENPTERTHRLRAALANALRELTPEQRKHLDASLASLAAGSAKDSSRSEESRRMIVKFVQAAFAAP